MNIINHIVALFAIVSILCGCAEKNETDFQKMADASFDHLMTLTYPDAEKLESGMYIEWIDKTTGGEKAGMDKWLMLNYRGTNFEGQVFSTRDAEEAKKEGTFTSRTRYTPHFMAFNDYVVLSPGEIEALPLMSKGDKVRLYIPTKLGFAHASIQFQYGYEGWLNSSAKNANAVSITNIPVIVELSLEDVISDPNTYEFNAMSAKIDELGFTAADRITDSLYFRYTDDSLAGDLIGEDSTFYISYTGRFLDDFVLKTNDPQVGTNELRDFSSAFMPLQYKASSPPSNLAEEAIIKVIKEGKVRYDTEFRILFTSVWGYGAFGMSASATNPVVYPYTPLYYDIKTHPWGYDLNE